MRSESSDPPAFPDDNPRVGESPILVSGHLDAWWCWSALAAAVILAAVAGTAAALRLPIRFVFAGMAVAAAVTAGAGFAWQFWRRQWLTWTSDSIEILRRHGRLEILDTDIESLAVTREYRHSVGRIIGEAHCLWVWTKDGSIPLEARSALGEPSPFASLVDRLQRRLEKKAVESIRRDGFLKRPDWAWQERQVIVEQGGKSIVLPATSISAVDNDVVYLRIWVDSDPLPAARLSQSSRDVWLLGRMLESTIGALGDESVAPASGLGRILHESRPRSSAIMATMLSGLSATVALLAITGAVALRLTPLAILGAGTGMGTILLGSTARRLWRCTFRLHETGISQRSLTGDRALRFHEISQFVFDARRQYSKGRYLGTLFTMVFASDTLPKQGILHTERCAYETDDIARVRDRVSDQIAASMATALASTGELLWTRELAIRGGTLHCQPRRFMRWTGKAVEVPLDEIQGYDVAEGWLFVWSTQRDKPLFRARTAEPNFYPGLLVFEQLVESSPLATDAK